MTRPTYFQLAAETLEASEDGQTWTAGNPRIIVRDAANAVINDQVILIDPPITGTRIGATIETVVLPVATSSAATPES